MQRFMNPYIIDKCSRVAREPIRKLSRSDRITAPMLYAHAYGQETPHYITGIAAVLLYRNPDDAQSMEIGRLIAEYGVRGAYEHISGVKADCAVAYEIEKEYERLKETFGK